MQIKRGLSPALVLFFLSPAIGELLSSSAPPAEFFNPPGFIMLSILYGGGAILARELVFRWGKSWPSLLVLGAAYGIAEEGLMCKSFFDPGWMDVGILGEYGRWLGVNWVWSVELTMYHAVFSIVIPVTLVTLLFLNRRTTSWISRRGLVALFILWLANGTLIFLFISKYRPPILHYAVAVGTIAGLCVVAKRLPVPAASPESPAKKAHGCFRLFVFGFTGTVAFFTLAWVLPHTGLHPLIVIVLMVTFSAVVMRVIRHVSSSPAFSDRHKLAMVWGALGFFMFIIAPVREWAKDPADNPAGMFVVGLGFFLFFVWLWRRTRSESSEGWRGAVVEPGQRAVRSPPN
jgi:hypothetical protein